MSIWARSLQKAERLKTRLSSKLPDVEIRCSTDIERTVRTADVLITAAKRLGHDHGIFLNPLGMTMRVGIAGLDCGSERLDRHQVGVLQLQHRDIQ